MSLFPAYSGKINKEINDSTDSNKDLEWLKNSSCQTISLYLNSSVKNKIWKDSSDKDVIINSFNESKQESSCKRKKHKKKINYSEIYLYKCSELKKNIKVIKKKTFTEKYETDIKNVYFEDRDRNKRFLNVETLELSMRPKYNVWSKKLVLYCNKNIKEKYFRRYHAINLDNPKKIKKKIISKYITEKNMEEIDDSNKLICFNEQKQKIEEFNKKLTEFPKDINIWLEYVQYQDNIQLPLFSPTLENIKQVINQKKLSIVEKGLEINCNSIELLDLKLKLMSKLLPIDQFSKEIEAMIKQDVNNILLRQTLVTTIQTSCVLCKVSKVLNLYVKYFSVLKQKSKTNSKFYDKQILQLLYQCLIFLRHAGLWEQMWEILKINLCLNLNLDLTILKNINIIDEKILMEMEEIILTSKLPLNQLWLRIELLRERCHWIGIDIEQVDINLIGDEKRLVSAEETNDFIYPTISVESNFRLIILSLLCLKVPLLPSRHCTLQDFKEKYLWTIDSLETILPMIYSTVSIGPVDKYLGNKTMITSLLEGELTSGPQFLKFHPAQESYLDFIRLIFHTTAEKLSPTQKISIYIWWLRFERLLLFFTKYDPLKDQNRNKKVKNMIKNFLKKPENRNNLHFYREFALFEHELGYFENSIETLKKVIESQDIKFINYENKVAIFSLYRTIFEILLDLKTYKDSNLEIFHTMVESLKNYMCAYLNYNHNIAIEDILFNEIQNFFVNSITKEPEDMFMLPNIHCDILICYAYLLVNKNNGASVINDILNLFNRCLIHCHNCFHLQERFFEAKITFLKFCRDKCQEYENILIQNVNEAIKKFPNNSFFLSINALSEIKQPCWKLKTSNKRFNILSILANCLAGRARIIYLNNLKCEEASTAMINKMLSFHKTISKIEGVQNCPLIWRFYMLLIQEHDLCKKKGEDLYYEAVTQCPWARSVYISAAEIAPQNLSQIQDLIKERELRMHVTPEELDILRE